jgi:hypothetical protein
VESEEDCQALSPRVVGQRGVNPATLSSRTCVPWPSSPPLRVVGWASGWMVWWWDLLLHQRVDICRCHCCSLTVPGLVCCALLKVPREGLSQEPEPLEGQRWFCHWQHVSSVRDVCERLMEPLPPKGISLRDTA